MGRVIGGRSDEAHTAHAVTDGVEADSLFACVIAPCSANRHDVGSEQEDEHAPQDQEPTAAPRGHSLAHPRGLYASPDGRSQNHCAMAVAQRMMNSVVKTTVFRRPRRASESRAARIGIASVAKRIDMRSNFRISLHAAGGVCVAAVSMGGVGLCFSPLLFVVELSDPARLWR